MRLVLIIFSLSLAGCVSEDMQPAEPLPVEDTCKASQFAHLLGEPAGESDFSTAGRPVRVLPPNTIMTQDYRPERLNADLDASERVIRMWCG